MIIHRPSYFPLFSCTAGDCPDTCCSCWCVVVDSDTEAFYRSIEGELGERIRRHLTRDAENETCIAFEHGRCAMLTEEGLCSLQRAFGEQALSDVCNRFPRFRYEFGGVCEEGVSISCPEACRLVLETPFTLLSEKTDALPSLNDIRADRYYAFSLGRKKALEIAGNDCLSISQRLLWLLDLAKQLEDRLAEPERVIADCAVMPEENGGTLRSKDANFLKQVFAEMEYLQDGHRSAMLERPLKLPKEPQATRLLQYYIYKYFLQAAYDGQLLKKMQFAAASLLLMGDRPSDIWSFSRETEHSEPNLSLFYHWAGKRRQKLFSRLLSAAKTE